MTIEAEEPAALNAWLRDPTAAPHGGESLTELIGRVGAWLDARAGSETNVIAVTHAAVIRAAVVHAIVAAPASFWRIDIAPLSQTVLHERDGRWTLRATGSLAAPAAERRQQRPDNTSGG